VPKAKAKSVKIEKPKASSGALKLDLHGMRSEEAIEKLDQFLSDALLQGWDEVLVYHGIGTGKLAFAVKNYLKDHPSVVEFKDAPPHMGGYGAKVISL
jgi:DNA mismatch repair protein MutS2